MKRALIFNPAFPVLGGGERYTIALGNVIARSHDVTYASPYRPDRGRLERLGFPPIEVQELDEADFPRASVDYDLAVVVAADLPPASFATRSVVVVQFPRGVVAGSGRVRSRLSMAKLHGYERVVYSEFVRRAVVDRWGVDATVLMPGVEVPDARDVQKENLILSVGRFVGSPSENWTSKRQDVLIEAFSRLPADVRRSWRLVLAGGCSPSAEMDRYLEHLRRSAAGLDIVFEVNVTAERLAHLQDRARLFWHASGFERPVSEPEQAEHFGMSTAEAMCHGALPLVFGDGGQVEIVTEDVGRLWRTIPELVERSTQLMAMSEPEMRAMEQATRAAGMQFGLARFEREAHDLLERVGALGPSRGATLRAVTRAGRAARWLLARAAAGAYAQISARRRAVART